MDSLYLSTRALPALVLFLLASLLPLQTAQAQDSKDFSVLLRATVAKGLQPTITIHWNPDQYAKTYYIYRKSKSDAAWPQNALAVLDSNATEYADDNVEIGKGYEYQVFKHSVRMVTDTSAFIYYGTGYIYAGIEVLPSLTRGKVLLLVDSTMAGPLSSELKRLHSDLMMEGWSVARRDVPRTEAFDGEAVKRVKDIVTSEYQKSQQDLTSVFIIGRVAVPYSGRLNPDGHNDHIGAWPADGYYGDIDGQWNDLSVRDTSASRRENRNVPGDGKFDHAQFPSPIELSVGRVDFYNMPIFTTSETELLRKYLDKDHAFRIGGINARLGGVIDDNFSAASYQEAFASAGWRNIAVFGGDSAVTKADWFGTLGGSDTLLWAYGCGGGTYQSAGGIGGSSDFTLKPVNAVFTMLFGSYFGDWDSRDNFLRAAIAGEGTALTCTWVARPQWYFHHMALGETIGYSTVLSQNNNRTYIPNVYFTAQFPGGIIITSGNRMVHTALMGDPTLRAQMSVIPVPDFIVAEVPAVENPKPTIRWRRPAGRVDGYLLWRAPKNDSANFKLITPEPITDTSYTDATASGSEVIYRLQPVALRSTASGTYYDGGLSVEMRARLATVPSSPELTFSCSVAPNPARDEAVISALLDAPSPVTIEIHDITGQHVATLAPAFWSAGMNHARWDLRDAAGKRTPAGVYVAKVTAGRRNATVKIVVGR